MNGVLVTGLVHPDASSDEHARIGGFDLSTGKLRWERRPGGISVQSLLPHRGLLLALHSFGSKITALDARDGRVVARRRLRGYGGSGLLRVAGTRFAVIGRSGGRSPCGSSTGAEIGPAHQGSAFRLSAPGRSDLRAGQAQGPRWISERYHSTLVKPSARTGRRMTRPRAWKQSPCPERDCSYSRCPRTLKSSERPRAPLRWWEQELPCAVRRTERSRHRW